MSCLKISKIQVLFINFFRADANKVGDARSEPNHSPFLPAPSGRLEFSMNPLKMINQLIGPELKKKIIRLAILAACAALCVMMIPMIFSNLMSQAILSIVGL
jgi:hypothetical protein